MITLIPCASVPGLEVLDPSNHQWVQIEKWASVEEGDLCVIGCRTLERVTGGFYRGNIHRVVGTKSRQSMVFKMRAPSSALIDINEYGSSELTSLAAKSYMNGLSCETVGDWMLGTGVLGVDSVNFPGKSKGNYHNIVLSPNVNQRGVKERFAGRKILQKPRQQ
eukprot:TRINITY_DN11739_c0_g1_i1.p1 TRINITY_DN11739_c0_g1~~TRINITY_DN11739_c0_g1_i1.p1  ORF type:complete len:172 (-),score=26.62 TRINITY_DN11739_c0_g1_i1:29-520(-)